MSLHAVSIFLVKRGHDTQPPNFISVVNILKIAIVDARATIAVIGDNKNGMNFLPGDWVCGAFIPLAGKQRWRMRL